MYTSRISLTCALVISMAATSHAETALLRTVQALDEVRGYCLDIRGEGPTAQLDAPLQAHTCKYGAPLDDQRFELTADGALRAAMVDRCLTASSLAPGAQLFVRPCSRAATQRWTMTGGAHQPGVTTGFVRGHCRRER